VALTIALNACTGSDPSPTTPAPATISPAASAYLEEVVTLLERHSFKRRTIDWTAFRREVLVAAGAAQTPAQTTPGIRRALELLGDGHSVRISPRGVAIAAPTRTCEAPFARFVATPDVGYVRVQSFAGTPAQAAEYAQQLQDTIRALDRDGLRGWIVDLRGNMGGNMYPMLAGVGPLLGDGVAGYFLNGDSAWAPYSYRDGVSSYADMPLHQVSRVYRLRRPNPRVAVLTNGRVASAGEAVAVAFRARPDTRSFGTETAHPVTQSRTAPPPVRPRP
jgi:hypothetical protein